MKVKNDFPNVDKVLRKLKIFVSFFKEKQQKNIDENEKQFCKMALNFSNEFINSIENYLDSACNAELRIQKIKESTRDVETIRYAVHEEDKNRTLYHSNIISSMHFIDKIAERVGLEKVFDYAEEFSDDYSPLSVSTIEEKNKMTERQRVKRRELGNFGLYIAAAVTAGVSREASEITDEYLREFANCDGDKVNVNTDIFKKVQRNSSSLKRNMEIIIDDI